MPRYGIILLNLGGPDSLSAVEPFLYNLFADPDIIPVPLSFLFQKPLAKIISHFRAPGAAKHYAKIGGKSPIMDFTSAQAKALEIELQKTIDCKVYPCMRYWHPFTDDVLKQARKDGITDFLLLPLYPHYSITTSGSGIREFHKACRKANFTPNSLKIVKNYPTDKLYIQSFVEHIEKSLCENPPSDFSKTVVLFSAHSLPVSIVKKGDPYFQEIQDSMAAMVRELLKTSKFKDELGKVKFELSFQSKVGPVEWLGPATVDTTKKLASEGIENFYVVPISFVSDHIETLFELDIELREIADESGIKSFNVVEPPNHSQTFIQSLASLARNAIKNEQTNCRHWSGNFGTDCCIFTHKKGILCQAS